MTKASPAWSGFGLHPVPRRSARAATTRGRYFEDFTVGRHLRAPAGTHHQRSGQHLGHAADDEPASAAFRCRLCQQSEFGRPLVNSCLTLSIVAGMSVSDVSQKAIGNLGWTDIKLIAPVFVGDTIYAESEVLPKRQMQ
jgi:itaconyl-CoA hydratase